MRGDLTHPVGLLLIGSEGAAVIFSILGMVGVGLIRAGMRLKAGALLMLIGATGVAASTADYPLVSSITMASIVEATVDPVDYPDPGYDIASLAPTVALLVGRGIGFSRPWQIKKAAALLLNWRTVLHTRERRNERADRGCV
jgi:hypothetical protein